MPQGLTAQFMYAKGDMPDNAAFRNRQTYHYIIIYPQELNKTTMSRHPVPLPKFESGTLRAISITSVSIRPVTLDTKPTPCLLTPVPR